jgi:hypothetical protein
MAGEQAIQPVHYAISPQSTMTTVSEYSSPSMDPKPLPTTAKLKDVLKRLGLNEKSLIHKSLLVRSLTSLQ